MFSEASSSSAGCFVCSDSADVFWLCCPLHALCTGGIAVIVLFCVILVFRDTSKLFGPGMNAEVPIVYCRWRRCDVCMLCSEDLPHAYSAPAFRSFHALFPGVCMQIHTSYQHGIAVRNRVDFWDCAFACESWCRCSQQEGGGGVMCRGK